MCKLFLGILYWSAGLVSYKGNIEVLNACCKNLEMESTHRHTPCSELGLAGEKRSLAGSPLAGLWFDEYVFLPCALVSVYSFSHLKREISSVDSESYDTFKLYFRNFVCFDFIWKAEKWQISDANHWFTPQMPTRARHAECSLTLPYDRVLQASPGVSLRVHMSQKLELGVE